MTSRMEISVMAASDSGLERHLMQRERIVEIKSLHDRQAVFKDAEMMMEQADRMLAAHGPRYRQIVDHCIDRMLDAYFAEKRLRDEKLSGETVPR